MVSKARKLAQKAGVPSGRRNLIINGAMGVHQRGGTISAVNAATYTLDRFTTIRGSSYNYNVDVSQSSEAPDGFVNSLKIDVQATATPSGGENFGIEQKIESQNTTHLNYGSSSGKYIVLSFWVRSNKTGTYGLQLVHNGKTRNFISSYTIDSADTWENKTIVINPDTDSSSAFDDDTEAGLRVVWHLSTGADDLLSGNRDWTADGLFRSVTGQVNLLDSTSNEFYITGVQLEVGTVPTEFEYRSFGEELALCQRYFYRDSQSTSGVTRHATYIIAMFQTTRGFFGISPPVPMRIGPTVNTVGTPDLTSPNLSVDGSISSAALYAKDYNNSRFSIDCTTTTSTANTYRSIRTSQNEGFDFDAEM